MNKYHKLIDEHNQKNRIDTIGYAIVCIGSNRIRYLKQLDDKETEWVTDEKEATFYSNHSEACSTMTRATNKAQESCDKINDILVGFEKIKNTFWKHCRIVRVGDSRCERALPLTVNGY